MTIAACEPCCGGGHVIWHGKLVNTLRRTLVPGPSDWSSGTTVDYANLIGVVPQFCFDRLNALVFRITYDSPGDQSTVHVGGETDTGVPSAVLTTSGRIVAIDSDPTSERLFYVVQRVLSPDELVRVNYDGSGSTTLTAWQADVASRFGVQYDLTLDRVYYTKTVSGSGTSELRRVLGTGGGDALVHSVSGEVHQGPVIDVTGRQLFWYQFNSAGAVPDEVKRSDMDGGGVADVYVGSSEFLYMCFSQSLGRLYVWDGTVARAMDPDGTDVVNLNQSWGDSEIPFALGTGLEAVGPGAIL